MPLKTNPFGVDRFVSFEIIERAARAPGPRPQSAPIVQLARLALVAQADDPLRQSSAVIRLDAGRVKHGIAPAFGKHLLLPRGTGVSEAAKTRAVRTAGSI